MTYMWKISAHIFPWFPRGEFWGTCCNLFWTWNYCNRLTAFFQDNLGKLSWHQKGKPIWILLEQEMMGWQWHQLDHMQIICTSLQTDNHASTSPLSFYRPDALPAAQPTVSKHWRHMLIMHNNTQSFYGRLSVCLLVGSFDPQKPSPKWPIMCLVGR